MNLQRHENNTEDTKHGKPWYLQPEVTHAAQQEPVLVPELQVAQASQVSSSQPLLFEPSAAERILAQAGALQEVHGQMLSREQIEAIAAEIGIKPEFVHLAIEQEKSGVPSEQLEVVKYQALDPVRAKAMRDTVTALAAYTVGASLIFVIARSYTRASEAVFSIALILPFLLSLLLGITAPSRRWGTAAGAAVGMIFTTVLVIGSVAYGDRGPAFRDVPFVAILVGLGALLGLLGAQARRVVSRRQASNRSRRKITRE